MRKNNKKKAAAAGTIVALVGAGAAFAYWTTTDTGTGAGDATTGVANQLSFDQNELNAMFPGDTAQNLTVTVTNDATENAYVSTVKGYITTDKAGCTGG